MKEPQLTIIVLSYNTKKLLDKCLKSLEKLRFEANFEVLVPDNGSTDGSAEMVESKFPWVKKIIRLYENKGFAAGNNSAKKFVEGEFVLFLNSDTIVPEGTLRESLKYINSNSDIGALSCKVELPDGTLDKDTRRSFITPWIGLSHIFLKLDRLFPRSKFFARYWYGYISSDKTHEVDAIQGAFFLTRKKILDKVGWFDETYFLDGEDIDLSYRIREEGWKIIYYPKVKILHLKGASKGKNGTSTNKSVSLPQKLKYRMAGVNSMEIFYTKHLWKKYPLALNIIVLIGIKLLKVLRVVKTVVSG